MSNKLSRLTRLFGLSCDCRCSPCRFSPIFLASASEDTTLNRSPASGTPLKPSTSTGVDGPTSLRCLFWSLIIARTLPLYMPAIKESPIFNVPSWTRTVAATPLPRSNLASMIVPLACRFGLLCNSRSSASSNNISRRSSTPVPSKAEISTKTVEPPHSSGESSCPINCCLTRSGFALVTSILLTATIIGTPAAFAWSIASIV